MAEFTAPPKETRSPEAVVESTVLRPVSPADRLRSIALSKEVGITVLLIVLGAITAWYSHGIFLGKENLYNQANLIGMYGIFGIGAGIVIITGGIDLTVGSMIALLGVVLAMLLTELHWPWPLALLFVLAIGALLGQVHGLLITRLNLQPFIVTLCGLLLYRGIARFIAQDQTEGFGYATGFEKLQAVLTGNTQGVIVAIPGAPMLFNLASIATQYVLRYVPFSFLLFLVIALVMAVVLHRSVYGRYLYAIGRNEEAARFSGINTKRVVASAYVLAGLLTATSAVLFAFYTNSISPASHGNFYELYGIAAAVLGGCSLRGGEGSIFGILIGTALLQVLHNLVNLLGIPSSLDFAVMGAVILIGVITDQLLRKKPGSGRTQPSTLSQYAFSFYGRISRQAYWRTYLFLFGFLILNWLAYLVRLSSLTIPSRDAGLYEFLYYGGWLCQLVCAVVLIWGSLAVQAKRWHDLGVTGWASLTNFIPLVNLVFLIYLGVKQGQPGANKYGEQPYEAPRRLPPDVPVT